MPTLLHMALHLWIGLAHGEVFVDPGRAEQLIAGGAAVLDARGQDAWERGHLPGARPLPWAALTDGGYRSGLLNDDLEELAARLSRAGVDDDRPALIYGAAGDGWGEEGRLYWTLDHLGHDEVYILDGGAAAWTRSGRALTTERPGPATATFTPRPDPDERALTEEVEAALKGGGAVIWDTRQPREYAGATPYGEARGGHIPGAVHLHWKDLLAPDGTLRPEPELRQALAEAGLPPDKPVIALCTGGVRSGFAYAVLEELGYPQPANYDGSMWAWSADRTRPMTR